MNPSSPDGLTFFLDQGLGSRIVADTLRYAGWQLEIMDERYGKDSAQRVEDVQWIEEAASSEIADLCRLNQWQARRLLARMVDEEKLTRHGQGRWTRYRLKRSEST